MKRIWIGIGFLVVLLAAGLVVMQVMDHQLGEISDTLEQAAEAPTWERSVTLANKAEKGWQSRKKLITALTDHNAIDAIEGLFARLEIYGQQKDKTEHAATCAQLAKAVHALEENHRLAWYNLL